MDDDGVPSLAEVRDALLSRSTDALFAVSPAGHILSWNEGAALMYGLAAEHAVGQSLEALFLSLAAPELKGELRQTLDAACKNGSSRWQMELSKGIATPVEVDLVLRRVPDGDGRVQFLTAVQKDLSQYKQLLNEQHGDLRLRGLLEAAPDAMIIVDRDGRITLANHQMEKLFGHTREDLIGERIEILVPQRFRKGHPGHRTAYFGDPRTRPMGAGIDLFALRKDGTEFPAEISLAPIETEEGVFATAAVRDISERRKVEAKFRGLLESAPDAVVIVNRGERSSSSIPRRRNCSGTPEKSCWGRTSMHSCRFGFGGIIPTIGTGTFMTRGCVPWGRASSFTDCARTIPSSRSKSASARSIPRRACSSRRPSATSPNE